MICYLVLERLVDFRICHITSVSLRTLVMHHEYQSNFINHEKPILLVSEFSDWYWYFTQVVT